MLDAIAAVPRAGFVPPAARRRAYHDVPIPIAHEQVTTQPSLVAKMLEGLALTGGERVLEVGSGYGWQTALLSTLAREVFSVERWPDVARTATDNLRAAGASGWAVVTGDGTSGLPEHSPYDAIIVCAAYPRVPAPLAEQLRDGGRLVQPIGRGGSEEVIAFDNHGGELRERAVLSGAYFVRLVGRHGFTPERGAAS